MSGHSLNNVVGIRCNRCDIVRADRQEIIEFFKALASRSNIALSTASTHLSILKRVKILVSEKIGKDVYYRGDREYMAEVFKNLAERFMCC